MLASCSVWHAVPSLSVGEPSGGGRRQHEVFEFHPLSLDDLNLVELKFEAIVEEAEAGTSRPDRESGRVQGVTTQELVGDASGENEVGINLGYARFLKRSGVADEHPTLERESYDRFALPRPDYVAVKPQEQLGYDGRGLAELSHRLLVYYVNVLNEKRRCDRRIYGRRPTEISNFVIGAEHDLCVIRENINSLDGQFVSHQPRALICGHLVELSLQRLGLDLHRISLAPGIPCQARQVADSSFKVGGVGSVLESEVRKRERPETDESSKPLTDRKTLKKAAGAALVILATICGAIGFALFIGAASGRDFGLTWASRRRFAIYSIVLFGLGFFVLSQWASPFLRGS